MSENGQEHRISYGGTGMSGQVILPWAALAIGVFAGSSVFGMVYFLQRRKERKRIEALTAYLEEVNTGGGRILLQSGEDDLSKLQDEIYKTVTELYRTREMALEAKNNFAENLYNIAHQIKTPITSASLSLQMMRESLSPAYIEQIQRQLSRLARLEESLLLLSRLDAGVLSFEKRETDVFTLLELAAEQLEELFREAEVSIEIPEAGEMIILADMEWTMEAVMNLLKNCMEHTLRGGMVRCSYEQNPIYTQITITDTGSGFAREDIPHLFERFYRGKDAKKEGVGIGLALSKEIIERQNGTITARNLPGGGGCFEIRIYRH